jgi:hypothetical protein
MKSKLRALGLGMAAVLIGGGLTSPNAPALVTGHFVSSVNHTTVVGNESTHSGHSIAFVPSSSRIVCTSGSYQGTMSSATVQSIQLTPSYSGCATENESPGTVSIHLNKCTYTFFSRSIGAPTFSIACPGTQIEYTHANCTIRVPAQTVSSVEYDNVTEGGKNALTLTFNANLTSHYESGICIFLGTNQTMAIKGAVTVKGFETAGPQVNLTKT